MMNVENRLRESFVVCCGDHQLGCGEPAVTVLAADLQLIDTAGKGTSEHLGQPRDRRQNGKRIPVDKHNAGIRVDRAKRGQGENVIGAFENPSPDNRRLMLKVLQEALVKPVGVEMSG